MCDISCCCCCYDNDAVDTSGTRSKRKYRKINMEDTSSIVSEIDIILPQYEKVPVDKIFKHQQPLPNSMYVHPQLFQKDESSETAITQQPQASSRQQQESGSQETTQSYLELSMYYDMQRRVLTVYLNSAEIGTDSVCSKTITLSRKEPTVFVVLFLIPHKEQVLHSATKKITHPYFDQKFEFPGLLPDEIRCQSLVLRLLEKCKNTQNELGTTIISLEHADLYGISMRQPVKPIDQHEADRMLQQFHSNAGSILLSLMHDSSSFIISGILLKAKNLRKMNVSGLSDPYVKIYLIHKGSRVYKWKSTVKNKTLAPIYNETFQFDVTEMDMRFVQLELKVINDHDILGSNLLMGTVDLGSKSEHCTGKTHWTEMTSSPCNQICYWHSLDKPLSRRRISIK